MLRIAFTSCHDARVFPQQPVWTAIAQHAPDHLVLLGDKFYLDIDTPVHPEAMTDDEFARHQFALYQGLIGQPEFAGLVGAMPAGSVHAIWDDHDFLWNDACGADVSPIHQGKIRLSTAFLEIFRGALQRGLGAGSFPTVYNDARFWNMAQGPLDTPSLTLAPDVWLHLSDGRTHRTRTWRVSEANRTILGAAQRDRFTQAVTAQPRAIHLFASASPIGQWQRYAADLQWIEGLAAAQRMLVLSGDIHRNRFDGFYAGALPLHEATASGAAVRDAVVLGAERQNFGLVDIDAAQVQVRLFDHGAEEGRRTYDRANWLPL